MTLKTGLGLIAVLALSVACAPAEDDPRRKLGYVEPDAHVEPGFSRNQGFQDRTIVRSARTSNRFGRSRQVIRSSRRFNRRRIDR